MCIPISLHKALRSFNPVDLTSLNDFGVIGIGVTNDCGVGREGLEVLLCKK
jgi:hypothetical protein